MRWTVPVGWAGLALLMAGPGPTESARGVWRGQDGVDEVGASSQAGPNGIADVRMTVTGLPAGVEIVSAELKGHGGGAWAFPARPDAWALAVRSRPAERRADLYFEPGQVETGRDFNVILRLDRGRTLDFWVKGGPADPSVRAAKARVRAGWSGPCEIDAVGPGPAVGPDGILDTRIDLDNLPRSPIVSARIEGNGGRVWESGPNPRGHPNAEVRADPRDPTRGVLLFQPDIDLKGQALALTFRHADGSRDTATLTAGTTVLRRSPAPAAPRIAAFPLTVLWNGPPEDAPGEVELTAEGLPHERDVVAAVLSDVQGDVRIWKPTNTTPLYVELYAQTMSFRRDTDRGRIRFAPGRNLAGVLLTLRLVFDDGTWTFAELRGGTCDPGRRQPGPTASAAVVKPGDSLHDLIAAHGAIVLATGVHELDRPLVLDRPVTILGQPGSVLKFRQPPDAPPWTAAIKVHRSHTRLQGFAVRFAGPVRWAGDVQYGPAVIGATDNLDRDPDDPKFHLAFEDLDLEGPPPTASGEEAPRLFRMARAASGRIARCRLRGGCTEVFEGPWEIVDNDYRGAPPGSFAFDAFAGHRTRNLLLARNRVHPVGPSGKTWRFLVLTQGGEDDRIVENVVSGIGPREGDGYDDRNTNEIVLTEAYTLHFEGAPTAVSADGRILQIPPPQGGPVRAGDVVAILEGPEAGQYRRVAQTIDAQTFLLDQPLPTPAPAVSIGPGFVRETFQGNIIDVRGAPRAGTFNLVGHHYGTRVLDNGFLGGDAVTLSTAASERPVHWGWSREPMFDLTFENNVLEDVGRGIFLNVEHGKALKSSQGRTYLTATVARNEVRWTTPFLQACREVPPALTIGMPGGLDPAELVVRHLGNRLLSGENAGAERALRIVAGRVNGRRVIRQESPLSSSDTPRRE